jgi:hypothetical protein
MVPMVKIINNCSPQMIAEQGGKNQSRKLGISGVHKLTFPLKKSKF